MRNVFQVLKDNNDGFSLLEVSVALIVIGIMASIGLPALTAQMQNSRFSKTHAHQEYVMASLASYLQRNQCLPGAGDPKARGANYGKSMPPTYGRASHSIGIIPFQTLGIAERYAKDGFGNLMTYAVKPHFAKGEKINIGDISSGEAISLVNYIQGQPHQNLQTENDAVAVVLISHGEKGHGAYMTNGDQINVPNAYLDEATNSKDDLQFVDRPYSVNSDNYFGHIVVWETLGNLGNRLGFTFKISRPTAIRQDEDINQPEPQEDLLY